MIYDPIRKKDDNDCIKENNLQNNDMLNKELEKRRKGMYGNREEDNSDGEWDPDKMVGEKRKRKEKLGRKLRKI